MGNSNEREAEQKKDRQRGFPASFYYFSVYRSGHRGIFRFPEDIRRNVGVSGSEPEREP